MNELELKYGCNPNQKPARIYHGRRRRTAHQGAQRQAGLHQLPGRLQLLAAGEGAESGHRPARGRFLQACRPRRAPPWACPSAKLNGRSTLCPMDKELSPHRLRLYPGPRRRPAVLLSATGRPSPTSATPTPPATSSSEVSDGVIAPGYTDEALEILKAKSKGGYNVVQIDPDYVPAASRAQGCVRHHLRAGPQRLWISTRRCSRTSSLKTRTCRRAPSIDMIVALITLKYTQSNSVCYRERRPGHRRGRRPAEPHPLHPPGRAARPTTGICASIPRCWALQFVDKIRRPDRDNAIDIYHLRRVRGRPGRGRVAAAPSQVKPEPLTAEEKKAWIATQIRRHRGLRRLLPLRGQRGAGQKVAACPTSWSRAAPSGTIM